MTPDRDDLPDLRQLPAGSPPDAARLAALRTLTLTAFADADPKPSPKRKSVMTPSRLAAGALLALAATIAAAVVLRPASPPDPVRAALAEVAEGPRHFRLTEAGEPRDLFVSGDGRLRLERTADKYTLVADSTAFAVDEAANRYTPLPYPEGAQVADAAKLPVEAQVVAARPTPAGTTYTLNPPAEVDLDAAGNFVELREYAAGALVRTLTLLADPVPPGKGFALKPTLSEDGRVGKVTAVQGLASVKPVNAARFTPLRPDTLLMPGDIVRVDGRGANAATLRLLPDAVVIAGPGTTLEISRPDRLRLTQGEAEVTPTAGTPIELRGSGDKTLTLNERGFYRLVKDELTRAPAEPVWLKSLKGTSVNESLGSLVAQVDGRAVPLTVGVHKVSVEIRDQIARTTIEETFVNNTKSQLEGVFTFPLPQDASIAGFAMWIGNERVEADVVEKQRAREIYETILREKRDPGLLEWQGGNLFKARVFPIFAHSEKRVSITYTQVLPAVGKTVRYSYALQSEMLRQHPLKELSVTVTVASAVPLKAVTCPTHPCRTTFAGTAARLEFTAQEYTPTRDFEAVIELADDTPAVTLIPHRRGGDGYFLVRVTPPAPPQGGRDLVTSDKPLSLVLWCDTSASIDAGQRRNQAAVAAALLAALTPGDAFNLAATDVTTVFAFDGPAPATPENVEKARSFLAARPSLGWSDLTGGLTAVAAKAPPHAQVVYLGDGVAGTVNADPAVAAKRLADAYTLAAKPLNVHAVSLGSTFESGVLSALAALGSGGSVRRVNAAGGTDEGATKVALDLLAEFTKPGVRNVKVAFTGFQVAKVYPEVLPNLTPGTQQILLGRYLPDGQDQRGEVVVTGTQEGREVRFAAAVTLKDAEAGNSFLPRLWARLHLDKLLSEPQTPVLKEDIVALSEEFHIMTPYTSFLVLESDADRERFGVKRRFGMRDGEQFFAAGRDQAGYALQREQMRLAGLWRANLRREVLQRLAQFDRPPVRVSNGRYEELGRMAGRGRGGDVWDFRGVNGPAGGPSSDYFLGESEQLAAGNKLSRLLVDEAAPTADAPAKPASASAAEPALTPGEPDFDRKSIAFDGTELAKAKKELADPYNRGFDGPVELQGLMRSRFGDGGLPGLATADDVNSLFSVRQAGLGLAYGFGGGGFGGRGERGTYYPPPPSLDALFPTLPDVPTTDEAKSPWPADATELATLVYRRPALATLPGGLTIERTWQDTRKDTVTTKYATTELISPKQWATRNGADDSATRIDWCDGTGRVALNAAFHLARCRAAKPADLSPPPVNGSDYSMSPLWTRYTAGTATVENAGPLPVLVVASQDGRFVARVTIDRAKQVVTRIEMRYDGKLTGTTAMSNFVQARGLWWPTVVETKDGNDKVTLRLTQTVTEAADDAFAKAFAEMTAPLTKCVLQTVPYPTVAAAKAAVAAGKATTDDRLTLLRQALAYQRFDEAAAEFDALAKLNAGKPAVTWLGIAMATARTQYGEALKLTLAAVPAALAAPTPGDRVALAVWLVQTPGQHFAYTEQVEVREKLAPALAHLPATNPTREQWATATYYALVNAGRAEEAFAYLTATVAADPDNFSLRMILIQLTYDRGARDAAKADLRARIAAKGRWEKYEADQLYATLAGFQEREGDLPAKAQTLTAWLAFNPAHEQPAWQLLSALVRTDAGAKADALVTAWLAAPGERPTGEQTAKFQAAVRHATGHGERLDANRMDPRWLPQLVAAARRLFDADATADLARLVAANDRVRQTDAGRALLLELFRRVLDSAATRPPARLTADLGWLSNVPEVDRDEAVKLAAAAKARWAAVADADARHALGNAIASLTISRIGTAEAAAFARERAASGPEKYRYAARRELFALLQQLPWDAARVDEAYALLPTFVVGADGQPTPLAAVSALLQVNDWAERARNAFLQGEVTHPERLTRPELAAKQKEAVRQARGELIDRLTKLEGTADAVLKPWAKLERVTLQAKHALNPNAILADLFTLLGDAPKAVPEPEAGEVPEADRLAFALEARGVSVALYAATRKAATPESVARVLRFLNAGVARKDGAAWQAAAFDLLVALDRPTELEAALGRWVVTGDPTGRWRTALGHLLAELGRFPEAIKTLESVTDIGPGAYGRAMALARLYMAVDLKAKHDAAKAAAYKQLSEQQLWQLLNVHYQPWQPRGGVALPTELDPDTLLVLAALVEKSDRLDSYLHVVNALYAASKDFRIPATLADAALGETPAKVYAVLTAMQQLLGNVRDEATADAIATRLAELRPKAKSPTDQRALDMLSMQVERRAAELINQPGPHAETALAAFRAAFERDWAPGEKLLMARLLRDLGPIAPKNLGAEQLRQLKALAESAPPKSLERLQIFECYAAGLRAAGETVPAVAALTPEVAAFVAARGGKFTADAYPAAQLLAGLHEDRKDYAGAEKLWLGWREAAANPPVQVQVAQALDVLYLRTLREDGEVSLGRGEALYAAILKRLRERLADGEPNARRQTLTDFSTLFNVAQTKAYARLTVDVLALAADFPKFVKPWEEQYDNSVQQVAQAVHDYAGPVEGIDFLVRRVETLPEWARYANNRGWDQHSNALAAWLREVRNLPPLPGLPAALDARLLTLVVAELTDDLTTRAGRNRTLYYAPYAYYWAEKEPAFAAAAEAVLAAHPDSVATRLYVANYLFHGCNRRGRAIDVLKELHAAGKLDTGGRSTLAGYLLETERFAEADGVLAPLVADQPDVIEHRTRLMTAYFRLGKPAELRDLYSKSLLRWREKNLWTTGAMAQFAAAAQACDMHREAADLYAELIPTVQRNTVTPNGQLAEFYRRYSLSLSAICKHVEAVDAAGGAIVAWGGDLNNRRQAILALNHAVARAGDLTPLVAHFDKQTAETGLVNPVVRKALGEAYRARQDYAPAATQLELALDGQPNDAETFGLLVDTYDKLNRKADAVGRILDALQLTPRDLDRYAELGKRYAEGGDAAVAERAFTSLVEVTRGEADGLMKLAARYQEQGRWAAAIPLWEQAAANRPLEPAGLLGLAGAQIEAKRFADARATIAKLKAKAWPAHAGDTPKAVAELEAKLSK